MFLESCFDISDYQIREREIKSLLKANQELKSEELLVITPDYESKEKIDGQEIQFIPLWKWLLYE